MLLSAALPLLIASSALVTADAVYTKNSPVLQVSAKTYDSLIAQSNHTSVRVLPSLSFSTVADRALDSRVILPFIECRQTRRLLNLNPQVLCSMVRPLPKPETCIRESCKKPRRASQGRCRQLR